MIAQDFDPKDRKEVWELVEPFIKQDTRLPKYILQLASGNKESVQHYVNEAKKDFRDIIFWVENSDEARLDSPEKIEKFQGLLEWAGGERDPGLDALKRDMELRQEKDEKENRKKP